MGSVTGTAALSCPLGTEPLIVAGTNNTGGESNYLMLNYTWANQRAVGSGQRERVGRPSDVRRPVEHPAVADPGGGAWR